MTGVSTLPATPSETRGEAPASPTTDRFDVAVVMATYRRPDLLRRCLEAVLAQRGFGDGPGGRRFEVIVVDDGRTADTEAVVTELAVRSQGRPRLRYLRAQGTRGPAGARNLGWRSAEAPLIAFTDDDTVPDAHWLHEGLQAMTGGLMAASGRVVVPTAPRPTDHARNTQGLERAEFVTANAFVRHEALVATGGFDERFTRAWREDSDLHFSLIERYGHVGRAERAIVVHPVREAPWGFSMSQQANVYFDALLYAKHRRLYREKVRHRPPWQYIGIVGAALGALVAAACRQEALALGLASASLIGCVAFARRRLRGASLAPSHVAEMLVTSVAIPFLAVFWRIRGAWRFRTLYP
jgi:hypothetical protein